MRVVCLVVIVFFGLILSGCGSCCPRPRYYTPVELTDVEKDIIRTINVWSVFAQEEYKVMLCSSYTKLNEYGDRLIWLDFKTQDISDVCAARRKMVWMIDSLLERLNELWSIEQTLTYEHLYVSIEFESYYGKYVDPLYVARAELKEGFLNCFYAHTALDPRSVVHHMHCEPFDTSREIVYSVHKEIVKKAEKKRDALMSLFEECQDFLDEDCIPPDEREFRVRYDTDSYWLGD